jgi:hypothetical protein
MKLDLDNLHFCKSRTRYRVHLTGGMLVSTMVGMIGADCGIIWMCHLAALANAYTALIWIWE